jgi:hypothetical protein
MNLPNSRESAGRYQAIRPALAFVAMMAGVVLICRGMPLPGLPAFLTSIAVFGKVSSATGDYRM